MNVTRAALALAAALIGLSVISSYAYADQVDDLLSGRPVQLESVPAAAPDRPDETRVNGGSQAPVSVHSLSEKSWEVTLAEPSHAGIDANAAELPTKHSAGPPARISVVPEPSAVALAAGALVYFLIFFRRRYSF